MTKVKCTKNGHFLAQMKKRLLGALLIDQRQKLKRLLNEMKWFHDVVKLFLISHTMDTLSSLNPAKSEIWEGINYIEIKLILYNCVKYKVAKYSSEFRDATSKRQRT